MHTIPIRHGMSIGELAIMINEEGWLPGKLKADLMIFQYTGKINDNVIKKTFIPYPSPNMPDYETAWLYQGLCLLEGTNISEGRGTNKPFKVIGAPWLDSKKIYQELIRYNSNNDKFVVTEFIPHSISAANSPKYLNKKCFGFEIKHLDDPIAWTIRLLEIVYKLHPNEFKFLESNFIDKLFGSDKLKLNILNHRSIEKLISSFNLDQQIFSDKRKKYLIYKK